MVVRTSVCSVTCPVKCRNVCTNVVDELVHAATVLIKADHGKLQYCRTLGLRQNMQWCCDNGPSSQLQL